MASKPALTMAPTWGPLRSIRALLMWWFATGLDNYVPNGKGPHTVEALTTALTKTPLAAGTGAFGASCRRRGRGSR